MAEVEKAVNDAEIFRGVSKPWNNKALALIVKEGIMRQQGTHKQQKQTETLTKRSQHFRQVSQELAKKIEKQEEGIEHCWRINGRFEKLVVNTNSNEIP